MEQWYVCTSQVYDSELSDKQTTECDNQDVSHGSIMASLFSVCTSTVYQWFSKLSRIFSHCSFCRRYKSFSILLSIDCHLLEADLDFSYDWSQKNLLHSMSTKCNLLTLFNHQLGIIQALSAGVREIWLLRWEKYQPPLNWQELQQSMVLYIILWVVCGCYNCCC